MYTPCGPAEQILLCRPPIAGLNFSIRIAFTGLVRNLWSFATSAYEER